MSTSEKNDVSRVTKHKNKHHTQLLQDSTTIEVTQTKPEPENYEIPLLSTTHTHTHTCTYEMQILIHYDSTFM